MKSLIIYYSYVFTVIIDYKFVITTLSEGTIGQLSHQCFKDTNIVTEAHLIKALNDVLFFDCDATLLLDLLDNVTRDEANELGNCNLD